jgi:hypothetical protein
MSAYSPTMSYQKLFAIFVALAVLFAPAFTRAGEALAAVPDHHAQMLEAGHCQAPPGQSGDEEKAPATNCCISMCMAVAIAPASPLSHKDVHNAPAALTARTFLIGLPLEIATPPPRTA